MMTFKRGLTPFLIALSLGAAHAASNDEKAVTPKAEEAQPKAEKKTMDTDTCRRDAKGMHGPDRARFMTDCIRKRD